MSLAAMALTACSLDETNYSTVDTDVAYNDLDGYQGIIDACYENVYYMYGKVDGIGPMEMGTDLWKIGSLNGSYGDITNYNTNLTTETGVLQTIWNALYAIVGYCNTAIYYQDKSTNFTAEEVAASTAEAYFLRGFAYFHIVEQWGGVVLQTQSFAEEGMSSESASRSTEEEIYDLIISDLNTAVENLPVTNADRGRATKKSALAMLAKAYLQRTRLYDEGSTEYKEYAQLAFDTAKELIDNAADYDCGLYASTATKSGNSIAWDDQNNKDNDEFLYLESVDHVNGQNPETWNRGRTAQYYQMPTTQSSNFGIATDGLRYGRSNATVWGPTLYLLQECFDPRVQKAETDADLIALAQNPDDFTPDTRFADAFYYKMYALTTKYPSRDILGRYGKDTLNYFSTRSSRKIAGSYISGTALAQKDPAANYYASGTLSSSSFEQEDVSGSLAVYVPNWDLDTLKTCSKAFLAVGPDLYFSHESGNIGGNATNTYFRSIYPSLKKYRCFKYVYSNQYVMMDIPIIRLTDIYLIAAEASIMLGTPSQGLEYLNAVRRHAALSTDASEMEVTTSDMTIDFILKERARELCGEQWRWYDLKRTGRLTNAYLTQDGMNPYCSFTDGKNEVRPIPQQFLDQIANPDDFGNNGY